MDKYSLFVEVVVFVFTVTWLQIEARYDRHNYAPFLSKEDASMFVRKPRATVDCNAEGACEHNPDQCTEEPIREAQCHSYSCPSGQVCYMITPCPAHYRMGCKDDVCAANPCQNGGTCVTQANYYTCLCLSGYGGALCEKDMNQCRSHPCKNGATCRNLGNGYTCDCGHNFAGTNCENDMNTCRTNPCKNGATCNNFRNSYRCDCVRGYVGTNCETDMNKCRSNPCTNGATCNNIVNSYKCVCVPGYSGSNCNVDINECQVDPCKNGATCNNLINRYRCDCVPGYTGTNCTTDINECSGDPCKNGATCYNLINRYRCDCVPGYTGTNCTTDINECRGGPCKNGATCNNLINRYRCDCVPGYTGTNCTTDINECSGDPCKNGATCYNLINRYRCDCVPGYTGTNCTTDINECRGDPCKNGATCNNLINRYRCDCVPGYTGTNCATDINECRGDPCKNGATCNNLINRYRCDCVPGYTGTNCTTDIDECRGDPCKHGATCNDLISRYTCDCVHGYSGSDCETEIDECQSSPCQHGTCVDKINNYLCICEEDYVGRNCEIDTCQVQPFSRGELVFVIDSSVSKGNSTFQKQKQFIKNFVSKFPIGPTKFQVAIVVFSFIPEVKCYLNTHASLAAVTNEIESLKYSGGASYTGAALRVVRQDVLTRIKGLRSGVPRYVLILIDGLSSDSAVTQTEANNMKRTDTQVITIAEGMQINQHELLAISSSKNDVAHVFLPTTSDALYLVLKEQLPLCPDCFHNYSDVLILFDMSNDIPPDEFYPAFEALKSLVAILPLSQNKVHLRYMTYAADVVDVFDWTHAQSLKDVMPDINGHITRRTGPANISKALNHVDKEGFIASKGARSNARSFVVMFSQGNFNDAGAAQKSAAVLRNSGVMIATVGVGFKANFDNLLSLASDPALTFMVGDGAYFSNNILKAMLGSIEFDVCEFD